MLQNTVANNVANNNNASKYKKKNKMTKSTGEIDKFIIRVKYFNIFFSN